MMGVVLMIRNKVEVLRFLIELVFLLCELFLQVGFNLGVTWSTNRWCTWQGTDTPCSGWLGLGDLCEDSEP